jgi:CHASE3 domain sensor protein
MRWSIGKKIGSGFGLALVALTIVGGVSYDSTSKLIDSTEWVRHTNEILGGLDELLWGMKDAETGQRGYIISGEARYLQPYQGAREAVDQKLKRLLELTLDNPIQQQRLAALGPLVAGKFAELQDTIDLRRTKGFGAAAEVVLTDKGKNLMDSLQKLVAEMREEETGLLARRSVEERDRAHRTKMTIVGGGLCTFALLSLAGVFLTRNIAGPLGEVSAAAQKIASGDLSVRPISNGRQDEVGVLAAIFMEMTASLGHMARVAEQISAGDLTVEVKPKSDKDVLGKAFAVMVEKTPANYGRDAGIEQYSLLLRPRDCRFQHTGGRRRHGDRRRRHGNDNYRRRSKTNSAAGNAESEACVGECPKSDAGVCYWQQVVCGLDRSDEADSRTDGVYRGEHRPLERTGPDYRGNHALSERPGGTIEPVGGECFDRGCEGG